MFVRIEERELFFSQSRYAWLVSNLTPRNGNTRNKEWQLVFGITLWYIWKERCNRTFGGDQGNWYETVLAIKRMIEDRRRIQRSGYADRNNNADVEHIGWKYPDEE